MSGNDLKYVLRKTEFPYCAREALSRVEQLCTSSGTGRAPTTVQMELSMELMAEFVFCEIDRRGLPKRKMSALQELRLLEVLCDYFGHSAGNNEAARNTVFMSLFPPALTERSRFLSKLVSMSISTRNIPVLTATGIWMQQLSCTSQFSLDLAAQLVQDFFVLVPKALSCWNDLPKMAPQFAANFLTTVAEMYGVDKKYRFQPPPDLLLKIITRWVSDNPTLCLAALLVDLKLALPMGGILMAAVTPFAGLLRWCVLAPLHFASVDAYKTSNQEVPPPKERKQLEALYTLLQQALLESLLECHSHHHVVPSRDNVLSSQHLTAIVEPILRYTKTFDELPKEDEERCRREDEAIDEALNRFGQAIQVALAVDCIYGNVGELFKHIDTLPENQLLWIVLNKHRS